VIDEYDLTAPGDWPIDPQVVDGTELAARLNRFFVSYQSNQASDTRPPDIADGGIWSRTLINGGIELVYHYKGEDYPLITVTDGNNRPTYPGNPVTNVYPIGSVYINAVVPTNPAVLLGFGTWAAFGGGRVPVGFSAEHPIFGVQGATGGSANTPVVTHKHSSTVEISGGTHSHNVGDAGHQHAGGAQLSVHKVQAGNNLIPSGGLTDPAATGIWIGDTTPVFSASVSNPEPDGAVSDGVNTNYPPFITVFMWVRVS
jgi:hypothetical protein